MENTNEVTVQIKVEDHANLKDYYRLIGNEGVYVIPKSYCTVVAPSVEETEVEVKGYCIKRTPENAEVLNKWASNLETEFQELEMCHGYIYSTPDYWYDKTTHFHSEKKEGFTELSTVSEFFEKVGYTPEPKLIAKQPIEGETWEYDNLKYSILNVGEKYCEIKGLEHACHLEEYPIVHFSCKNWSKTYDSARIQIGVYEGVAIFHDTKSWFVDFDNLKIIEGNVNKVPNFEGIAKDGIYYSKVYLTPEEANKRLKEEVIKKAETELITISINGFQHQSLYNVVIDAVEKKYNIKYLTPNTESK